MWKRKYRSKISSNHILNSTTISSYSTKLIKIFFLNFSRENTIKETLVEFKKNPENCRHLFSFRIKTKVHHTRSIVRDELGLECWKL